MMGKPLTVVGPALQPGDAAPGFQLINATFQPVSLADTTGKVRVISVVPSVDTGVCALQTKRFHDAIEALGDGVLLITVSVDLPGALQRFGRDNDCAQGIFLSDHFDMSFGRAYGTYVKELRQEQRAVFVVDGEGTIRHVEYVEDMDVEPDYDAALAVVRSVQAG